MSTKDPKETTTRELLIHMLDSQSEVTRQENVYTVGETIHLDLLLKAGGGAPAPLSRVERLTLHEDFLIAATQDSSYLFPFMSITGLRISPREKARGAGFHR